MDNFTKYRIEELQGFLERYLTLREKIGRRHSMQQQYFNDLCEKNSYFIDNPIYKVLQEELDFFESLQYEEVEPHE